MTKKTSVKRVLAVLVCLVMVLSVFAFPKEAQAGTYFKKITRDSITENGSYYFKLVDGKIYYSTTKSGTYKKTGFKGMVDCGFTDGKVIYAAEKRSGENYTRLSRYTISTGKHALLAKLPYGSYSYEAPGWTVATVYENAIFLTRKSFEEWSLKTYVYNISTGKLNWKKNNCAIESRSGQYLIARNEYQSDVSARKWGLYRTDSNGNITFLKTLGNCIGSAKFVGDYVYYSKYTNSGMNSLTICRCSKSGGNFKSFGKVPLGDGYSQVVVSEFKTGYCKIWYNSSYYKFTYSTKTLSPL